MAYLRGGQPSAAAEHYSQLVGTLAPPARAEAQLQVGYAHYLSGQALSAATDFNRWLDAAAPRASEPSRRRATYLLGWSYLALGDGPQAARVFERIPTFPGKPSLVEAARGLDAVPQKSPLVAGLLSLVPGAGHVYIGQPMIGVASFAWNGLFAYALYDTLRQGQLGVAAVLAVFESLWYFGSMFGAVNGAQKFNRDARQNFLDELRATYDDRPESWPPASPVPSR